MDKKHISTLYKIRGVFLVVTTYLLSAVFLMAGASKLIMHEMHVKMFEAFGLVPQSMLLVGALELVAAVLIAVKPGRVLGALLMVATMIGAAATHVITGVGMENLPVNGVLGGLAAMIAWVSYNSVSKPKHA